MNKPSDATAQCTEALIERLSQLIEEHSQAEIARKTETSRNNVSRYAAGTRMPLEFGTALVEGLGVNPSWLLTGEGTPYLSDVSADTQNMAGDLLALVEAMEAVARMRLGALTGKHHLKVLRELNDTLKRYEENRAKLNEHSRPIFIKLIDEIRQSIIARDLNRAEGLIAAARQVSRLTDDDFLRAQLNGVQSLYHHNIGDAETALKHQRKSFLSFLTNYTKFDEWTRPEAHNFVLMLNTTGRFEEARRVARAIVELDSGHNYALEVQAATIDVELGDLHRGLSNLRRLIPLVEETYAHNAEHSIARGQLLEGSMRMEQALTWGRRDRAQWKRLLDIAVMFENQEDLGLAIEHAVCEGKNRINEEDPIAVHANCLLDVLKNNDDTAPQRLLVHLENTRQKQDLLTRFEQQCWTTQLFRLAGDRRQAKRALGMADRLLEKLGEDRLPKLEMRILHLRNTLSLTRATAKLKQTNLITELLENGYHSLKRL
ncbi:MAG: helix-turn-helix domain-containing protein [Planctomycetota bacterium]|jgi:tetratricopeptide (TPR) repeat protein